MMMIDLTTTDWWMIRAKIVESRTAARAKVATGDGGGGGGFFGGLLSRVLAATRRSCLIWPIFIHTCIVACMTVRLDYAFEQNFVVNLNYLCSKFRYS
jgi:hypothetical protein